MAKFTLPKATAKPLKFPKVKNFKSAPIKAPKVAKMTASPSIINGSQPNQNNFTQ